MDTTVDVTPMANMISAAPSSERLEFGYFVQHWSFMFPLFKKSFDLSQTIQGTKYIWVTWRKQLSTAWPGTTPDFLWRTIFTWNVSKKYNFFVCQNQSCFCTVRQISIWTRFEEFWTFVWFSTIVWNTSCIMSNQGSRHAANAWPAKAQGPCLLHWGSPAPALLFLVFLSFLFCKVLLNYLPGIRGPVKKFLVSLRDWPVSK